MASTYLTRTNSTGGNRQVFTFSAWVKRGTLPGSTQYLFDAGTSTSTDSGRFSIYFNSANQFGCAGGATTYKESSANYRDLSAWYHLVVAVDSTQGTAGNRVRLYVNGSEVTNFQNNNSMALNQNTPCNENAKNHDIGRNQYGNSNFFDGCFAHIHFTDGTQYAASAFGETDATTGIWKPKVSPSVTYGTNGFFLKFASSGSMGTDSSGNGNNFTVGAGNLTQTQDTPSNVFPTINALCRTNTNHVLSNGNLTHQVTSAWLYLPANMGVSSGKWYAEMKINAVTNNFNCGVMELSGFASDWMNNMNTANTVFGANTQGDAWALFGNGSDTGTYKNNNTPNFGSISTSFGSNILVGDIINIALDCDNQKIWFGVNGSWDNSGDPVAGTNPMPYNTAMIAGRTYTFASGPEYATQSWNFGNGYFGTTAVSSANSDGDGIGLFEYAVPSGYYALCTKNINTYG